MLVKFCNHRRILLFFWDLIVVCCLNLVFYVDKFCPSGEIKNFRPLLKRKDSKAEKQDANLKNVEPSPAATNATNTNSSITTQPTQPQFGKVGHVKAMSSSLIVNLSSQNQLKTPSISGAKGMSTSLSLSSLNITESLESFMSSSIRNDFQQIPRPSSAEHDFQTSSVEVDIGEISTSPPAITDPIVSTESQLEDDLREPTTLSSDNIEHTQTTESSLKGENVTIDEQSTTEDDPGTSTSTTKNDQELSQSELEDSYPVSPTSLTADDSRKSSLSTFATDLSTLLQSNIKEKEASKLWRSESFASLASQKDDCETPQEQTEDDCPSSTECQSEHSNTETVQSSFADDLAVLILSNISGKRKKSSHSLCESITSAQSYIEDLHDMLSEPTVEHDLVKSVILKSETGKEFASQSHNDDHGKSDEFRNDDELSQQSSIVADSTSARLSQQTNNMPEKVSEDGNSRSSHDFGTTIVMSPGKALFPRKIFSVSKSPLVGKKEITPTKASFTVTDFSSPLQSPPREPDNSNSQISDLDGARNYNIDPSQSLSASNKSDVCIDIDKKDESSEAVSIEVPDVEITRF